jgi:hypothetical protein
MCGLDRRITCDSATDKPTSYILHHGQLKDSHAILKTLRSSKVLISEWSIVSQALVHVESVKCHSHLFSIIIGPSGYMCSPQRSDEYWYGQRHECLRRNDARNLARSVKPNLVSAALHLAPRDRGSLTSSRSYARHSHI